MSQEQKKSEFAPATLRDASSTSRGNRPKVQTSPDRLRIQHLHQLETIMTKQYRNMDKVSAAFAKDLDKRREQNKKRAQTKKRDASSLSRGGFRC